MHETVNLVRKVIITFAILISTLSASLSNDLIKNDSVQKYVYQGFEHIYNFEFNQCVANLNYLLKNYPKSPWTYVLGANYYWWKYLTGENDKKSVKRFNYYLNKIMEYQDRVPESEKYFCVSLATAFKSRLDVMNGKYINAMNNMMKEIKLITATLEHEVNYKGFYLTSGLYYYLNAAAYRDYMILRPFMAFIPKGDLNKGLTYLKMDKKDNILNTESSYFMLKILDEVENQPLEALKYGKELINQYPDNFIFRHIYYKLYRRVYHDPIDSSRLGILKNSIFSNTELSHTQREYLSYLYTKNYTKTSGRND